MERPVPDANRPGSSRKSFRRASRTRVRGGALPSTAKAPSEFYVARVGPFGFAMVALAVALVLALVFLLVLGAFVIFIPLAGALLAAAVLLSLFRGAFRRRY